MDLIISELHKNALFKFVKHIGKRILNGLRRLMIVYGGEGDRRVGLPLGVMGKWFSTSMLFELLNIPRSKDRLTKRRVSWVCTGRKSHYNMNIGYVLRCSILYRFNFV